MPAIYWGIVDVVTKNFLQVNNFQFHWNDYNPDMHYNNDYLGYSGGSTISWFL